MAVGSNFLYIQLCAYGNVGLKSDITVLIAIGDFQETVLWNDRTVCGGQILGRIESELHREDFSVIPDAEGFVLTENFGERHLCLLAFVIELGRRFGDLHGFACIGQFNRL